VGQSSLVDILHQIPGYDPWSFTGGAWLDEEAAAEAIAFFPECLRHVEGQIAGKPFELEIWQQAIVGNLFGWKRKDGKGRIVRRYREVFLYVPKKNGKTPLAAGICNFVLFCDGEPGAQIVSAAGEREQAALLFRHAKGMIEQEPELLSRCDIYGGRGHGGQSRCIVLKEDSGSVYKVLSADSDTKHGGNLHLALIDELHVQPDRDLVDNLATSTASENRTQPILMYITTADYDRPSICNEKHAYACSVRDNGGDPLKPGHDPAFLPIIFELKQEEDWTSEENWYKANPNLGISVSLDYLRRECQKAKEQPALENAFRRLHLNQKTSQDVRAISMRQWDECKGEITEEMLSSASAYGGLDLASTEDLASFGKVFKLDDGRVAVKVNSYCPADKVEDRAKKRIPYDVWAKEGFLTATEGSGIDYDVIKTDVYADADKYSIKQIGYDSWGADGTRQDIEKKGIECVKIPQSFAHLSAPLKELLRLIREKQLIHDGNPVLRWAASNLAVHFDGKLQIGENVLDHLDRLPIMPSKRKSADKIDPIMAIILAIGRMMGDPQKKKSVYEDRGLLQLTT
jgi:phage terminase large subunit-like protein